MTLLQRAEDVGLEVSRRLATITVDQGAETDAGRVVYRGRRDIDDSLIPCCVLIEGEDQPDAERVATKIDNRQRYVLFAYVPCNPLNPNDAAHAALRDLKRAMFRGADGRADRWFDGKVGRVKYIGRDIGPRSDGAAFVVASIEIEVAFVEDLANP